MQFSKKEQWIIFSVINALLFIAIALFPIYWKYVPLLPFSKCNLLEYLHIYCPACGGTRALGALLRFDILASVKYNPIVITGFGWFALYECAMIKHLLKKGSRPLLVKPWMIYITFGAWGVYFVLRNVLLLFGVDLVGNVLV